MASLVLFFFFKAKDGIRDYKVTGVQTCALPIYANLKAERCILHPRPRRTALPRLRRIPSQSAILRHKISGLPCNSQRINDLPVCDECIALFTIASQPHRVKGFAPRETLRPAIVPLKRLSIPPQTPAPCRRYPQGLSRSEERRVGKECRS